ncbi:MAG: hypothetical protein GXO90_07115 [FCB group bacterium]|nr:hypothetical protein [FCB group bacterium]
MNRQTKALLFSAFVFPGAGHLLQGRKMRGWIFIATELLLMILFIWQTVQVALGAMAQLEAGGTIPNMAAVTTIATEAVAAVGPALSRLLRLILAVWFVSLLDTWWTNRTTSHT